MKFSSNENYNMPPKKIKTSTKTTNRKTKKPLIKRIRLGRLLLVLILLSSIVYGSYIVISEIYSWGSFKYAQYQEAHPSKPQKPPIPPQFTDKRFENYTNILFIGIDDKPVEGIAESGRYADALMLVSMDHTNGEIRFLSLPRTIKTSIDGRKDPEYLSFTYYYGGAPLTVNTVSQLLNIPITQYVALDRKSIAKGSFYLQLLGSVMLLVFGIYTFRSNPVNSIRPASSNKGSYFHNFITAFFVTLSNPLIIFLFIGLFARFAFVQQGVLVFEEITGYFAIAAGALTWWLGITYFVNKVRTKFNLRGIWILNRVIGSIVMLVSVAGLIYTLLGESIY